MICVSLSGAVWIEDGPERYIKGPGDMHLFDVDGPEDDDLLRTGAHLEPDVEYSVWPDGTDRNEFRLKVERNVVYAEDAEGDFIVYTRDGDADDWQMVKATAPVTIDRRKTVWERLTEED